jgi:hypothetical protein
METQLIAHHEERMVLGGAIEERREPIAVNGGGLFDKCRNAGFDQTKASVHVFARRIGDKGYVRFERNRLVHRAQFGNAVLRDDIGIEIGFEIVADLERPSAMANGADLGIGAQCLEIAQVALADPAKTDEEGFHVSRWSCSGPDSQSTVGPQIPFPHGKPR